MPAASLWVRSLSLMSCIWWCTSIWYLTLGTLYLHDTDSENKMKKRIQPANFNLTDWALDEARMFFFSNAKCLIQHVFKLILVKLNYFSISAGGHGDFLNIAARRLYLFSVFLACVDRCCSTSSSLGWKNGTVSNFPSLEVHYFPSSVCVCVCVLTQLQQSCPECL